MPSIARRACATLHSGNRSARSHNVGIIGRQKQDPRQDTLTQMDFFTARCGPPFPDQDLDLEYERQEDLRPRKKRRKVGRSLSLEYNQGLSEETDRAVQPKTSLSSPGPVLERGQEHLGAESGSPSSEHISSDCEGALANVGGESEQADRGYDTSLPPTQAASNRDKILMPPPSLPETPKRRTRTYVPSSQSPETTPLTIRTTRTTRNAQQAQRSPLKEKSANVTSRRRSGGDRADRNPFKRFAIADTFGSEPDSDSLELIENDVTRGVRMGGKVEVSSLELAAAPSSGRRKPSAASDLASSPNVELNMPSPRTAKSHLHLKDSNETRKTASQTASQTSTQDPSQPFGATQQDPELPPALEPRSVPKLELDQYAEPACNLKSISFSQLTTQAPTQLGRWVSQPVPALDHGPAWPVEQLHDSLPSLPTHVPSSQATTVVPSSDPPLDDISQPQIGRIQKTRCEGREAPDATAKLRSSPPKEVSVTEANEILPFDITSSQARGEWEWDGKDWTESQMLPESLMNWVPPGLGGPDIGSQQSLSSLGDEEDELSGPAKMRGLGAEIMQTKQKPASKRHKPSAASSDGTRTPVKKVKSSQKRIKDELDA